MRAVSSFLVLDEPAPARADAIVVLGGGGTHGARESRAAELFRAGVAPIVVTTGGPVAGQREATYAEWSIERLMRRGVPREAIAPTYQGDSTLTDAWGARRAAEERGWRSVVVVTDDWHSRRADATFDYVLAGSAITHTIAAARGPRFNPQAWWLDETSALLVVSEYVKLLAFAIRLSG